MVSLYKDPDGETVFSSTTAQASKKAWTGNNGVNTDGATSDAGNQDAAEISTLRKRVAELEQTVRQLEVGVACWSVYYTQY